MVTSRLQKAHTVEPSPVIEKIKKLLALAHSSNEHEAALAAGHAQRLLAEHNLAMADIEAAHRPDKADTIETTVSKSLPKWLRHLSAGVSSAFDCQAVHHPATGKMTFIGVGADVQVAVYTFTYLDRTIRMLCSSYMKRHATGALANRHRELMRHSYYLGAVTTITARLREQKAETPVTTGALVPVKEGLIRQAMTAIGTLRTMHSRKSYINSNAYTFGQADGATIGLRHGVTGTASPRGIGQPR
ncbi:MAG TPA: DUF2786 domain-containing protein [Desulfuromonadales bacterium]|nr:DUF2786 domain-containing protein [Desulfuromonadales bacterium]